MASPPDYDSENMPLITCTDTSNEDNSQMCQQLVRWLDENNLGNQDLISISSLKDALAKTTSNATRNNSKTPGFIRNKDHKHKTTVVEVVQNYKTYIVGIAFLIALSVVELSFLFSEPVIGIIVALSVQAAIFVIFLLLTVYWWGRRGPSITPHLQHPSPKATSANIARANMEYYA